MIEHAGQEEGKNNEEGRTNILKHFKSFIWAKSHPSRASELFAVRVLGTVTKKKTQNKKLWKNQRQHPVKSQYYGREDLVIYFSADTLWDFRLVVTSFKNIAELKCGKMGWWATSGPWLLSISKMNHPEKANVHFPLLLGFRGVSHTKRHSPSSHKLPTMTFQKLGKK